MYLKCKHQQHQYKNIYHIPWKSHSYACIHVHYTQTATRPVFEPACSHHSYDATETNSMSAGPAEACQVPARKNRPLRLSWTCGCPDRTVPKSFHGLSILITTFYSWWAYKFTVLIQIERERERERETESEWENRYRKLIQKRNTTTTTTQYKDSLVLHALSLQNHGNLESSRNERHRSRLVIILLQCGRDQLLSHRPLLFEARCRQRNWGSHLHEFGRLGIVSTTRNAGGMPSNVTDPRKTQAIDIHGKSPGISSRELTYPTLGKGKSSSKCHFLGDMLIPWRVLKTGPSPRKISQA